MKVIKRDGSEVEFDVKKIEEAIKKSKEDLKTSYPKNAQIKEIAEYINFKCIKLGNTPTVEDIQDMVENQLMSIGAFDLAKNYVQYRYKRDLERKANTTDAKILSLIECNNEEVMQENSNKDPVINSVQRDYMAGEVSKDITRRYLLPKEVIDAWDEGAIHFHDADYFAQHMHNCDLVGLDDMLQNGTVISETRIDKPHTFSTACNIAMQIVAQVASQQYGGQSISLAHLAPFVEDSRKRIKEELIEESKVMGTEISEDMLEKISEMRVKKEIERGVQTIQYQVITLMTTNGQAPFLTVFMYLNEAKNEREKKDLAMIIEEVLKQRIKGVRSSDGTYITPAFPKLIYVLEEDNAREGSKYWYLTELAAKCTAKRLVPDYVSEKIMKELKEGNCFPLMGCRSCLQPYRDLNVIKEDTEGLWEKLIEKGYTVADNKIVPSEDIYIEAIIINNSKKKCKIKYLEMVDGKVTIHLESDYMFYSRFNQGVCTINLPFIGLLANKDVDKFWKVFDHYLEICYEALMCRHRRLLGTSSDVAPILWQNGALARLKKGEKIDRLLFGGYSTISLGYAGLNELCYALFGKPHTDPSVTDFALSVMQHMNDKCAEWYKKTNVYFSLYGTPLESTTYSFAKKLKKKFGEVENVTDRNFITNSYHVHVEEEINAFDKLALESKFQRLSPGGAISYVEVPNLQNNTPSVLAIMEFIYDNIMYAELNTKSDHCEECGFNGEIKIVEDGGKLVWECPKCGNRDQNRMHVTRRTCGYIGTNYWNQGRTEEILNRFVHENLWKFETDK